MKKAKSKSRAKPKAKTKAKTKSKTKPKSRAKAKPKAKSSKQSSEAKAKSEPKTVNEYLARVPEPARSALNQMRAAIRSVVPVEATEILSYRIPAFKHKKVLVWYAAFTDHCSLFPTAAVIEKFKKELEGYAASKGTIHFPLDKALPTALIRKVVKERVKESGDRRDLHPTAPKPGASGTPDRA